MLTRRHPSPTKEMLEPLLRTASSVGLNLDVSSSKALAESLDNAKVRWAAIFYSIYYEVLFY
jgi:exosome complex exonuclease DIS3/RRP44